MSALSPKSHLLAFRELIDLLTHHKQLTWEMTKREITDRYAGQVLGTMWAVGHPLVLMGIYVFIFAVVLKVKVGGTREMPLDYSTYLLAGLIPWMAFAESMSKNAVIIISNANLVKQVIFPIEVLPVKSVLSCLVTQVVSTVILILYVLISHGSLPWTYILLPVLFLFQLLAMIGVGYLLSSVGAYFRDIKDIVQVFCVAGMYMMPVFFLPQWVPPVLRPILYFNPFSYFAWCYQDACYYGRFEHPWAWLVFIVMSLVIFSSGYQVFRKLKTMFGNVL